MHIILPPHKKVSSELVTLTPEILADIDGMKELLQVNRFENNRSAYAIAHCQVSENPLRLFVSQPEIYPITIFINPKIVEKSKPCKRKEGCLSFPFKEEIIVERFKTIKVEFQTLSMTLNKATLRGKIAQVFQHELEHFEGKTIYDNIDEKGKLA